MTSFGELKLSVIDESVRNSIYKHHAKMHEDGSKFPSYESFFNECLNVCKEKNVDLRSNWLRFYNECKNKYIDPKKQPCTIPLRAPSFQERVLPPPTEEDFWKVERDVVNQPDKWEKLGYIKNPWAAFMLTLPTYEYMELYLYYLQAHPEGKLPLQDELLKYHNRLLEDQTRMPKS